MGEHGKILRDSPAPEPFGSFFVPENVEDAWLTQQGSKFF